MALHLAQPQPPQGGDSQPAPEASRFHALCRLAGDLFHHIQRARAAGKAERLVQAEARRRDAERRRIGAESLAVNVRAATGNYGKPKPR